MFCGMFRKPNFLWVRRWQRAEELSGSGVRPLKYKLCIPSERKLVLILLEGAWKECIHLINNHKHRLTAVWTCSAKGIWQKNCNEATTLMFMMVHCHILEKAMATHASTLAWKIPWTEEPGGLQSMGSGRVRHDWSDLAAAAGLQISRLKETFYTEVLYT